MTDGYDIDGLAAEYVLGSLDAAERRLVDARRQEDKALEAAILAWERRLGPLSEWGSGQTPPPQVLDQVLSRIAADGARPSGLAANVVPLRSRKSRRMFGAGASALAASLALAIGWLSYQQPPSPELGRMDCGKLYKDFWQKRDPQSNARTSPEQLAGLSRMVLRAYDACQAGDEQDAKALMARLRERSGSTPPAGRALPG
jgi:hypothetical protein